MFIPIGFYSGNAVDTTPGSSAAYAINFTESNSVFITMTALPTYNYAWYVCTRAQSADFIYLQANSGYAGSIELYVGSSSSLNSTIDLLNIWSSTNDLPAGTGPVWLKFIRGVVDVAKTINVRIGG